MNGTGTFMRNPLYMDKTGWFQFGWHFIPTVQAQFFGAMISNLTNQPGCMNPGLKQAIFFILHGEQFPKNLTLFFCGRMGCSKVPTPCRVPDGTDAKQKQAQRRMEQARPEVENEQFANWKNEHHVWFTLVYIGLLDFTRL